MGYYTNYEITITSTDPKTDVEQVVTDFFQKEVFQSEDPSALTNQADISRLDCDRAEIEFYELKWYDYERDIRKLAKKNPDLLIVIQGTGEGDGNGPDGIDLWKHVFKGKEDQRVQAKVSFPEFSGPFEGVD